MRVVTMLCLVLPLATLTQCSQQEPHQEMIDVGSIDQEAEQNPTYHFIAGEVAIDRGYYDEALTHYVWLANHMSDPVFAARATGIAIELKNNTAAAQTSQIWAQKAPRDPQTQAIAASLSLHDGCIDCAIPYLSALLIPSDTETMQYLMQVHATLDNVPSQKNYIVALQTLGEQKKDTRALFVAANLQYDLGDNVGANKTIDAILAIKPDWVRANALRIQLLYENGQKKEAYAYLNSLLKKAPDNAAFKWLAARMALELGDTTKGVALLKTLTQDKTYGSDAIVELVKQCIQSNKFAEARQYLDAYQAKNPKSDEGYFLSGFIAQETGKMDQAALAFQQVKEGPYYLNARVQMALIQTKQGQVKEALADVERLSKEFPEESERIDLVRAQILLDSNQFGPAYAALSHIINTSDNANVELHYVRGLVAIELNQLQNAITDLKFVIAHDPKHLQAINMLTEALITHQQLQEAKKYNDMAMTLSPKSPEVLNNAGWIQFKAGDFKSSIHYLAQAYQATNDPTYAARLGEVLWAQGQHSEAVNIWNRGLSADPTNELLLNAMRVHLVHPAAR